MRAVVAWAPAVAAMSAIFWASSIPDLSELPAGLSDHSWHFIAYFGLGATLLWAFAHARWAAMSWSVGALALVGASVYGALDEWHQSFVHGRTPDVHDWIADTAGAAVAVGLAVIVVRLVRPGRPAASREV